MVYNNFLLRLLFSGFFISLKFLIFLSFYLVLHVVGLPSFYLNIFVASISIFIITILFGRNNILLIGSIIFVLMLIIRLYKSLPKRRLIYMGLIAAIFIFSVDFIFNNIFFEIIYSSLTLNFLNISAI